jgi:hypothetical protein
MTSQNRFPETIMPGSALIDQSQKMTVAATHIAEKNVWAARSWRIAMRRQSFSLPNMISILPRVSYRPLS